MTKEIAIVEALKIDLKENHLYHALLAELYADTNKELGLKHLEMALKLSKTKAEKKVLTDKLEVLKGTK